MKTSTCFKGSYSIKVSYSRTVSNYFECTRDDPEVIGLLL